MKRFGLIGNPISHSKSPALFKAGYNGEYTYDLIEESDFEAAYNVFIKKYNGVNVTAPFKEDAFFKADIKSDIASKIKATNLLKKTYEGIMAFNTDFAGVVMCLLEALMAENDFNEYIKSNFCLETAKNIISDFYRNKQPSAVIIGCGGAGKAAAAATAMCGFKTTIINRTQSKAAAFADNWKEYDMSYGMIEDDFNTLFKESNLVIYTLPNRTNQLARLEEQDFGEKGKIIIEANYKNPSFDKNIHKLITANEGKYISGRRWLLYQAVVGYNIFTGKMPSITEMENII